ncbi:glycosyltransferase [uncultured Vibrio sp.]|uniref:glycosyltransferase family protein n=1 Tax=uncultured Vibrio sp. TaxID=114054 RepID=UPI000923B233|nr:glycosyltransferase [uncultured Vibrio sp.]OIQ25856.1 MAG: hypothetical protein BM561_03200 [Vibrio sp. MedPE-SWchi]
MRKFLFYSHDSYGLGNIRRMVAIANYLVNQHRDLFILLITGSPMLHAFRTHPQIDYIKLPCLQRSQRGTYSAKLACLTNNSITSLRSQLIKHTVTAFGAELILVDKKPEGLNGELNETLTYTHALEDKPKMLLLLRDILDGPEETKKIWNKNHYFQRITNDYDEVLVVGEQAIFDLPKQYSFPESITAKTSFCGYLERSNDDPIAQPIRDQLNIPDNKRIIIVAAGGGDDGKQVLATYLKGIKKHASFEHLVHSILFYGPEMNNQDSSELEKLALDIGSVTLTEFTQNFISYLSEADLVVSMGGYNTICEILSVNKPAIIIPRESPVKEQLIRAKCLSNLGIIDYIRLTELDARLLMENISSKLFPDSPNLYASSIEVQGMVRLEQKLMAQIAK